MSFLAIFSSLSSSQRRSVFIATRGIFFKFSFQQPISKRPHLHLLLAVLGGVLAALALPAQLLQFGLALLQTLAFALVFQLVFLQGSLRGATGKEHRR